MLFLYFARGEQEGTWLVWELCRMVAQKLGLVWTWSFLTAISYAAKQTYLCCAQYASSLLFLFFFFLFSLTSYVTSYLLCSC